MTKLAAPLPQNDTVGDNNDSIPGTPASKRRRIDTISESDVMSDYNPQSPRQAQPGRAYAAANGRYALNGVVRSTESVNGDYDSSRVSISEEVSLILVVLCRMADICLRMIVNSD